MLLQELHEHYGTYTKLTKDLDLGITTYQNWLRKGYIPYTTQLIIEKKSKGKFKAVVSHAKPQKED